MRNAFPRWGINGPYVALDYFAKMKAQGKVHSYCTDVKGNNPKPGEDAENRALSMHPLPDPKTGKPRTTLSIPLDTEMLTKTVMALNYQEKVEVSCSHIDYYQNTDRGPPPGVKSDLRFFHIHQVHFDPGNMHDSRTPGYKFTISRPKAQEHKDKPTLELDQWKAAAKKMSASVTRKEKKEQRLEGHSDWNVAKGDWYTAKE